MHTNWIRISLSLSLHIYIYICLLYLQYKSNTTEHTYVSKVSTYMIFSGSKLKPKNSQWCLSRGFMLKPEGRQTQPSLDNLKLCLEAVVFVWVPREMRSHSALGRNAERGIQKPFGLRNICAHTFPRCWTHLQLQMIPRYCKHMYLHLGLGPWKHI